MLQACQLHLWQMIRVLKSTNCFIMFLLLLDNMFVYADMPGLCKKDWNGIGWSYHSATWKYFKGILFGYLS